MRSVDEWKTVLRDALRDAQRARRASAVAALRETLAAIDNAETADPSAAPQAQKHGVIAGGVPGLGAGEVARRVLSAQEVTAVVEREIQERRSAAAAYEAHGRGEEAVALRAQADLLVALAERRSLP